MSGNEPDTEVGTFLPVLAPTENVRYAHTGHSSVPLNLFTWARSWGHSGGPLPKSARGFEIGKPIALTHPPLVQTNRFYRYLRSRLIASLIQYLSPLPLKTMPS